MAHKQQIKKYNIFKEHELNVITPCNLKIDKYLDTSILTFKFNGKN